MYRYKTYTWKLKVTADNFLFTSFNYNSSTRFYTILISKHNSERLINTFFKKGKFETKISKIVYSLSLLRLPLQIEHNITIQTSKDVHRFNANESLLLNNVYKYDIFWKWPTLYLKICILNVLYISYKNAFIKSN